MDQSNSTCFQFHGLFLIWSIGYLFVRFFLDKAEGKLQITNWTLAGLRLIKPLRFLLFIGDYTSFDLAVKNAHVSLKSWVSHVRWLIVITPSQKGRAFVSIGFSFLISQRDVICGRNWNLVKPCIETNGWGHNHPPRLTCLNCDKAMTALMHQQDAILVL